MHIFANNKKIARPLMDGGRMNALHHGNLMWDSLNLPTVARKKLLWKLSTSGDQNHIYPDDLWYGNSVVYRTSTLPVKKLIDKTLTWYMTVASREWGMLTLPFEISLTLVTTTGTVLMPMARTVLPMNVDTPINRFIGHGWIDSNLMWQSTLSGLNNINNYSLYYTENTALMPTRSGIPLTGITLETAVGFSIAVSSNPFNPDYTDPDEIAIENAEIWLNE